MTELIYRQVLPSHKKLSFGNEAFQTKHIKKKNLRIDEKFFLHARFILESETRANDETGIAMFMI